MIRMQAYKGVPTVCPPHGDGVVETPDRDVLVGGAGTHAAATADRWDATIIQKDKEMEPYRKRYAAARKAFDESIWFLSSGDPKLLEEQRKAKREYDDASDRILVDPNSGASLGADERIEEQAAQAWERQKQRAAAQGCG